MNKAKYYNLVDYAKQVLCGQVLVFFLKDIESDYNNNGFLTDKEIMQWKTLIDINA